MAKKYYEGSKRKESGDGHKAFVTGHDPDVGRMDHSGMPKETVMSSYPPNRSRRGGYLDDSMAEIDAIQVDSDHQVERNISYQK